MLHYLHPVVDDSSWFTGLMHLCMNDMLTIRSLVDTLRIPNMDNRVRDFECTAWTFLASHRNVLTQRHDLTGNRAGYAL